MITTVAKKNPQRIRKPARRLTLEAVVIIASILAAFALDRWWDMRRARQEQQQVLAGLESEFRQAKVLLERYRDFQERVRVSVHSILTALREADVNGASFVTTPDTALGLAYVPATARPSLGTLDGLLATARLGVIRNAELRNALASWAGVFDELAEEESEARLFVMEQMDPIMRSRVNVAAFRTIFLKQLAGTLTPAEVSGASRIPVDNEVIGVFAARMFYLDHGIDEYGPVLEHVDLVLKLIEASR